MKIPNPVNALRVGKAFVVAHRTELLLSGSIVSTVSAAVMAARAGYKSGYTVAEQDVIRQATGQDKLDRKEVFDLTWMNYIEPSVAVVAAVGATSCLHIVHVKEKKQLATAAILTMEQMKREAEAYKKDLLESVGVSKSEDEADLKKAAGKSGIAKVVHSDGEIEELYLVRDARTQRDVWSNRHRIEEAVMDINMMLSTDDSVDLNDFYSRAGFGSTPDGGNVGWPAKQLVGLDWDSTVRDDGRPVRQFRLDPAPKELPGSGS